MHVRKGAYSCRRYVPDIVEEREAHAALDGSQRIQVAGAAARESRGLAWRYYCCVQRIDPDLKITYRMNERYSQGQTRYKRRRRAEK
jgi:hypothetical protein